MISDTIWQHRARKTINISSAIGLLPDSTKPLSEPMLTNHQWGPLGFTWGQFHRDCSRYHWLLTCSKSIYIYINTATSPMGQGLKGSMCWTSETKSQSFVHRTIFPSPANVPRELPTHSHTRKYEQVMELYSDIHPHSSTFFSFFFLHEYVQ